MANVIFEPPDINLNQAWAKINIEQSSSDNAEVGTDRVRDTGFVQIMVYVPINTGTELIESLCEAIKEVFRNWEHTVGTNPITSIIFMRPPYTIEEHNTSSGVRNVENLAHKNVWYMCNVMAPFLVDTVYQ